VGNGLIINVSLRSISIWYAIAVRAICCYSDDIFSLCDAKGIIYVDLLISVKANYKIHVSNGLMYVANDVMYDAKGIMYDANDVMNDAKNRLYDAKDVFIKSKGIMYDSRGIIHYAKRKIYKVYD
jgi:hypothetical protein